VIRLPDWIDNASRRVAQFLQHLDRRSTRETDAALAALLTAEEWRLVQRLGPADRRHLLAVHTELVREGYRDRDLLKAALLHDVGKVDSYGRVTVVHRVAKVLLNAGSPELLARAAAGKGRGLRHGLYLAVNHPAVGAELARDAGTSERTCWLIAHHDDGTIPEDPELVALRAIDEKE
jgi:hypothetical protein